MDEITASDLLSYPHVVIMRDDKRVVIREYDNGESAHAAATKIMAEGDYWGEVIVCCRIRTLQSGKYAFRHRVN